MKNEATTTAIFAAIATVSLGLAWFVRPQAIRSESEISKDLKGQALFKELDPSTASGFRVVKFNEEMATLSQLDLAKDPTTEAWTLPSSDGYPADSAEQISQAIAPLTELTVLSTVSTDRGDHTLYGVVEPKDDMTISSTGVGTLLRVVGAKSEVLAALVIGKAVEGTSDQRYVRVPTEDAVYVVQLKTDAYTTQFEKWIKGEILTVRSMDISNIALRDYAIVPVESGYGLAKNFDSNLEFKDNKWTMTKFVDHQIEGSPETTQLPEGKVLAESALNDLRNSVQNLKIVNVRRKPAGLAENLKADESLLKNKESTASLQKQGFFPMQTGEVFAAGGELIVGTKDGINYLLRFGNSTISAVSESDSKDKDKEGKKEDDAATTARRYLLVTAQLDESKFPMPELKVVPETVEQMLEMEAAEKAKNQPLTVPAQPVSPAAGAGPTDAAKPEAGNAPGNSEPAKPESTTPAEPAKTPDPAATSEPPKADPAGTEPAPAKEPAAQEPSAAEPGTKEPATPEPPASEPPKGVNARVNSVRFVSTGTSQEEAKQETNKVEQAKALGVPLPTQEAVPATQPPATQPPVAVPAGQSGQQTELTPSRKETREELEERLQFLQESIRKENKRLLDARNDAMKNATKKVNELNAGFADWYYIVSESVYAKLRVKREQLFKSPEEAKAPAPGANGPAFPPGFSLPPGN
ncbi:MAG: DUF4340 domain-containing protein [Pirellulales bacterium]